jgi:diguanylate cyclase (GGDEF)-like protein
MSGPEESSRLPQRALGSLFLAGAAIGLVSLLLPHSHKADVVGLYSNVGLAFAAGATLWAISSRVPGWVIHLAMAIGTLLIARAVLLSGDRASFYSVWFIWVGLYAFYFFPRRAAIGHVGFVAVIYAATLAHTGASSPYARWLTTVTTLTVAGLLIDALVRRARHDASMAAANATRMTRVAEVAHQLAGVSDTATARPALCAATAQVTRADGVALWEPTPDGSALTLTASSGWAPTDCLIPFAGPPAGGPQAFTTGKATSTLDRGDGVCPGACLWHPVVRESASVAVLATYWKSPNALDDPAVLALIDLLAAEAAVTLERVGLLERLETVARTDELTGLPNRRAWQEELPRELARAGRLAQPLCVAMLDLDHFKQYNDERGHQAGDRLLKEVAGAWSSELRATDILARYGGEEFALALPGCGMEDAFAVVERLRTAIPGGESCSAGIARWDGDETAVDLLERADAALYDAKRRGRDQTFIAGGAKLG